MSEAPKHIKFPLLEMLTEVLRQTYRVKAIYYGKNRT